ncbi:hypothetical protein B0O99DRAFT_669084 [Bisporella sp. PMI_857]|nr:hypothetical protein B0O99DRAFT_669084 [Bisporella sp. PMI_857]
MAPSTPFGCDVCCRAFTRAENLERHKKTHHGGASAESFECPKCQARFSRRDVRKRHTDRCSGQGRPQNSAIPRKRGKTTSNVSLSSPEDAEDDEAPYGEPLITGVSLPRQPSDIEEYQNLLNLPASEISNHVTSYFINFHPALPILHRPSVSPATTPTLMLKIIVAIGCLYSGRRKTSNDRDGLHQLSQELWKSGGEELERFVAEDRQLLRQSWILQSWLLYMVYSTFSGEEILVSKAKRMYRFLVDSIREQQLLRQRTAIPPANLWTTDLDLGMPFDETAIHQIWLNYITQESLKMSVYAFYFFDFHLFVSCNGRPAISSIEFEWDLPKASSLWEADSAMTWWELLQDGQKSSGTYTAHHLQDEPDTKSLLAATQSLLSATASFQLLEILAVSPFATLCIVTNLECLVRDFTRCYYQLPPTLSDPNPLHILTQSQNAQVSAALRLIWGAMCNSPCITCSPDCNSLWHAVRLGCLSTKISLSNPDELLVGGIVENSPMAGLATAAHLTLGDYVATRRSGLRVEDCTLNILDDALKVMHEMATPERSAPWEGPWSSIQGFKMLLILWRIFRISIAQLKVESSVSIVGYPMHFHPSKKVVEAVVSALGVYGESSFMSSDVDVEKMADEWEDQYMHWIHQICDRRDVWDVGIVMTRVLEEIYDTATGRHTLLE